ncbi:hypothetical protein MPTK1_5g23310 [Marchantia polymorpha subsp. ruderalis]|uniref:Uncharacterized protein n=2 Tax=Marchantia polymorpha TaxID=3197 RepID=A0AAF6BLF6_MARPO|nr:hypothetical protein MARPO_0010s0127 [Marchantia polymorpha]PTQ46738.1 hypothetical protein MARPO_0010s0127 [Marchantia polymorpha]BBN12839.1 hypothetical protein Mp_5g23310 [Marchantia polymorpha subsp. ruderalis]BBN12840.1 hypothetical protein Mp_5g23310 [Marchantia polymorpha subsp. ruderalis]|eukprot:PTQ46737.1 hypothetical protein MARPO_0010s0127 [Marchantia polymorpha]
MEGCTARLSCTPLAIGSCLPGRSGVLRGSGKGVEASGGSGRKVRRTQLRCAYSSGSSRSDDAMGGDPRVQQMLVEMVQIQLGKARMNDFVDERSEYMRMIADEAQREYNRIAMRTMKGLDATGSRVLRQLDQDAYAIERELRIAGAELEAQEKEFEEYQIRSTYSRNEGLFFKNLYEAPLPLRSRSTLYQPKLKKVTIVTSPSRDFTTSYRQILYGGLSLVIVSFIWSSSSAFVAGSMMRVSKFASYGIILSMLMTQLAYVRLLTGDLDIEESVRSDTKLEEKPSKSDIQN